MENTMAKENEPTMVGRCWKSGTSALETGLKVSEQLIEEGGKTAVLSINLVGLAAVAASTHAHSAFGASCSKELLAKAKKGKEASVKAEALLLA
jgi:hypothetical protein